ncbi:MAG: RluA family pseudouridine synthase [Thermodesulfobacterium geofontis]|uniref:RluA family pseudouridine synthase n=2 Tax=Thermodesulfobacterium geofontis TaxID=1295609 RepID=A0A2N7PNB6_9BACT|nr:MAG: RluA family pseudouridine synthase [Thermodesulfobacterium geofontis]
MKKLANLPKIIYEDKYILVVNKPPGLVVQGVKRDEESLLRILKDFIKERDKKPGEVFLGVVHKLDKMVSGILVLAKRSKSAKRLSESFQKREVIKLYLARVEGILKGEGVWEDYLLWDDKKRKALVLKETSKNAKKAITVYFSLYSLNNETFLLLIPLTGRKHQLRAVLSRRGCPIIGDIKYGSNKKVLNGEAILLHSFYLSFPHPMSKEKLEFWAEIPNYFSFDAKYKNKVFEFIKRVHEHWDGVKYRANKNFM